MPTVRATMLINSVAFVKARFGADAHRRVIESLSADTAARFSMTLPEGARVDLEHLVAYMEAAKRLLAPEDADLFRDMGRFGGERDRKQTAVSHMVADRETTRAMLKVMWPAYYGEGRFEIVSSDEESLTARAEGFRGHPVLCERITGAAETQLQVSRIAHGACVFRGDPACEWTVWW